MTMRITTLGTDGDDILQNSQPLSRRRRWQGTAQGIRIRFEHWPRRITMHKFVYVYVYAYFLAATVVGTLALQTSSTSTSTVVTPTTASSRRQWFPRPNYFLDRRQIPPQYQHQEHKQRQFVTIARTVQSIAELTPVQEGLAQLSIDQNYTVSWQEISGATLATAVLLGLASTSGEAWDVTRSISQEGLWDGFAEVTVANVIEATVPGNAADVVTILLAESIGGVFGALATLLLNFVLSMRPRLQWKQSNIDGENGDDNCTPISTMDTKPLVGEAVASSEYFIAKSIAYPLLKAAGVSSFAATISSTILASIPYQIVKSNVAQQSMLQKEEELLDQLLQEKQEEEQKERERAPLKGIFRSTLTISDQRVDPTKLVPISEPKFDFVSFFSDITRWLEYDVLESDFQGRLAWSDGHVVDPSLCSAAFGFLAAASCQVYADCLYGLFRFGPQSKQNEVRSRTAKDWVSTYASTCVSSAALFGIYKSAQPPVGRWIEGMLAGGVDGCIGSDDFDTCLQTYIDTNAPDPSPEAQFRALATNLAIVGQRLQDVYADAGSPQEVGAQLNAVIASATVSAYSLIQQYIPLLMSPFEGYRF